LDGRQIARRPDQNDRDWEDMTNLAAPISRTLILPKLSTFIRGPRSRRMRQSQGGLR
jgi:hypothetical protein